MTASVQLQCRDESKRNNKIFWEKNRIYLDKIKWKMSELKFIVTVFMWNFSSEGMLKNYSQHFIKKERNFSNAVARDHSKTMLTKPGDCWNFNATRGQSLLESWGTTSLHDWQPPLIYVRFISKFLCNCSFSMANVHVILM